MKKFISMVMAAAMVVSLVPATAFAANEATFKVVGDLEWTEETADSNKDLAGQIVGPEVQMKVKDINNATGAGDNWKITLDFENAEVNVDIDKDTEEIVGFATVKDNDGSTAVLKTTATYEIKPEDDSVSLKLEEISGELEEDDVIVLDLSKLDLIMTKTSDITVTVGGKFGDSEAMTVVSVLEEGISVTLKKVNEVAEEESEVLKSDLIVEANVETFEIGQVVELKLNKGFEWDGYDVPTGLSYNAGESEDDVLVFDVTSAVPEFVFDKDNMKIEAVDAKVGDVATITVKVKEGTATDGFKATETVDAMEVIGESVVLSVDEDEDVPVIYSGVAVDNFGINDDSDHLSLEVTIEESVAGALDEKKAFDITLTEGVFVTDVVVSTVDNVNLVDWADSTTGMSRAFMEAYEEGEQEKFTFARKTFAESTDAMEITFTMELIAVPGFEGDVVLTLDGAAFEDAQEVTIAKFVAPYTVEASANDVIIDYRNTEIPTDIVVKEAEAGLWAKDEMAFTFGVEKFDMDDFEGDATYAVNEESEMELDTDDDVLGFVVDEESDEEAAVVTISDIALYMSRNIAAGAYDLEMGTSAGEYMMITDALHTLEHGEECPANCASNHIGTQAYKVADFAGWDYNGGWESEAATVKEGFVNVVTAGRDADDASFTTKVVVPVGESYIVAGEQTVALDVPAYVSASGYTMLPVRAVAVALGILNNNVLWDQASKTVTILYGQRIITMTVGAKVINVNGSAIPASSSPEVVDGRTFLPMRDLATALGVTDITWDAATKTATLNGNK